jgi:hypothetical protein
MRPHVIGDDLFRPATKAHKTRSAPKSEQLAEYNDRETNAMEALSVLAEVTKKTLQLVQVDPADIAARWADRVALDTVIAWLQKVREFSMNRQAK